MRKVTLTIDGTEYVALAGHTGADYLRLVHGGDEETVDALEFTLKALGENLRAAREHAGLTQSQLAKKLKRAQTTVSGSEAGKIRVGESYVAKLLKVCGLPEDWKAPR